MEISVDTLRQTIAPDSSGCETTETAKPTLRCATTADVRVPTSRWGTVASFVAADILGLLLVVGGIHLGAESLLQAEPLSLSSLVAVSVPVVVVLFAFAGLYRQRFAHPALEMQRIAVITGTVGGTAALTVFLATGAVVLPLLIAAAGALGMLVLPVCRVLNRILCAQRPWWGFPAVVVTRESSGEGILDTLRRWPEIGLRPVAVLSDTDMDGTSDVPFCGHHELAPQFAQQFDIPYVIVAMPSLTRCQRANMLLRYTKFFDHVLVLPDGASAPAQWTTGQSGEGLFGYGVRHAMRRPGARFFKRVMDVVGAGLATLVLFPVLGIIAWAIRRDSPGSVFYRQERMGEEGRIFHVLKFRTMYQDADEKLAEILATDPQRRREYQRYHKMEDDPRVTTVGRFLRRYSLDELPQLFNVLRGDMSLVGPRAYMPGELPKMDHLARVILQGPPGITGLWQVSGRNRLSFSQRVHLDVHYMQNCSLWLDLYLLVRTVPTVLSGEGAS